jgi:cephalosporin-C deacetylase-like acetyl esterase
MLFADAKKNWGAYTGSECKPADFDQFWDKALKDLGALTLNLTTLTCNTSPRA